VEVVISLTPRKPTPDRNTTRAASDAVRRSRGYGRVCRDAQGPHFMGVMASYLAIVDGHGTAMVMSVFRSGGEGDGVARHAVSMM
jgi:hypothetical protein